MRTKSIFILTISILALVSCSQQEDTTVYSWKFTINITKTYGGGASTNKVVLPPTYVYQDLTTRDAEAYVVNNTIKTQGKDVDGGYIADQVCTKELGKKP